MEQNLVGFPNSIYFHVKPYTSYFGSSYMGLRGVPIMWTLMFDLIANPTISPKLVMGIIQTRIVTNHGEPSDKDEDYSMKKHKSFLLKIIP
jgi:hypothetical protein